MKERGHVKLFLRPPHVDEGDKRYFTLEELKKISEYTDIPITVAEGFAGYTALIFNEYFDSEVTKKFIYILEGKLGRKVCFLDDKNAERRKRSSLTISLTRIFSEEEVNSASHFFCEGAKRIVDLDMPRYWEVPFPEEPLSYQSISKAKIGHVGDSGFGYKILCKEEIYEKMFIEEFSGLNFREHLIASKRGKEKKLWELVSNETLARMRNKIRNEKGEEIEYSENGNCFILDRALPPALYYDERDLKSVAHLDFCFTYERFGDHVEGQHTDRTRFPMVITSQRFRKWCVERKLPLDFSPIFSSNAQPEHPGNRVPTLR